jgi:hypothetical protein
MLLGMDELLDDTVMRNFPNESEYEALWAVTARTAEQERLKKLYEKNKVAASALILLQAKTPSKQMCTKTRAPEFKYGKTNEMVDNLKKKYQPRDNMAKAECKAILRDSL